MVRKVIISADPGKENFSVAIQVIDNEIPAIEYVQLLPFRITELKENANPPFLEQLEKFIGFFNYILKTYYPVECTMERFQVRFRTGGAVAEVVNIMLGICCVLCHQQQIPMKLVVASEWKNHYNRVSEISLEDTYKCVKKLPPHIIDSAFIGLYYSMNNKAFYTKENIISYCQKLKEVYDRFNSNECKRKSV